jgi:hypothetical protein
VLCSTLSTLISVGWIEENNTSIEPGAAVVFDFRMGRGREGPKRFLGNFEGILQTAIVSIVETCRRPKSSLATILAPYFPASLAFPSVESPS